MRNSVKSVTDDISCTESVTSTPEYETPPRNTPKKEEIDDNISEAEMSSKDRELSHHHEEGQNSVEADILLNNKKLLHNRESLSITKSKGIVNNKGTSRKERPLSNRIGDRVEDYKSTECSVDERTEHIFS